jgi:tetratricopeptide (TPR) repeat protein
VDEVLGELVKFLVQKGLFENSLIVFTSDHGEGLGDHGEGTHGYFIYQSTLQVPLIVHWPLGTRRFPDRMAAPARLLDVAPTIAQFSGLALPEQFQGQSLLGALSQGQPSAHIEVYAESLYASRHFGCSGLQSLRLGRFKYIDAPKPELYDLVKDPGETQNRYLSEKSMALSLRERLVAVRNRFRAEHPEKSQALSPEAVAALSSLGYVAVSSPISTASSSKPDPKDRLREFENHNRAIVLASLGRLAEANVLLQQLRIKLPDVPDIPLSLGLNQQRLGLHEEAAKTFREALKTDPTNVLGHFNLAVSLFELRQLDEAIKELQAVLTMAPYCTRADELLGTIWVQRRDYGRARDCFNHVLKYAPEDYAAHYNLGVLATMEDKWDEAERHLGLALSADPKSSEVNNTLGSLYLKRGDLNQARDFFVKTIALDAKMAGAHYNLGLVLRQQKKNEEAAQAFRQALLADPQFRPAREALQRLEGSK